MLPSLPSLPSLHALPINAPRYFGLDEDSSAELEDWLSYRDRNMLQSTNKAHRDDTASLVLYDWRRDENGQPRGPGEWDTVGWNASFTRGQDATGTRLQYVANLNDHTSIRGYEGGVDINIPFEGDLSKAEDRDDVNFFSYDDDNFPFAGGEIRLQIPEWGLRGEYELDYGNQNVRYLSQISVREDGSRAFVIRIRLGLRSTTPQVYVSFGFECLVSPQTGQQNALLAEYGIEDDENDEDEWSTARWTLTAVTIYREDEE